MLGHPALDTTAREARITEAAATLGLDPRDVDSLLWSDLALERPVVLSAGRPEARVLAAIANVDRVQRGMRRAREVELRVWDEPHGLVRLAARCGLLTHTTREPDGALLLQLAGPLSLFHRTTVYGRALAALVPLLANHERFELDIHCDFASGPRTLRVMPPVMFPPYTSRLKPSVADRLARDLEVRECRVEREPPPIVVESTAMRLVSNELPRATNRRDVDDDGDDDDDAPHVLFPDLAIEHGGRRWLVEVIGFSTANYLADKLARYAAAGERVILCVDAKRSIVEQEDISILEFTKRVDADALVERIDEASP